MKSRIPSQKIPLRGTTNRQLDFNHSQLRSQRPDRLSRPQPNLRTQTSSPQFFVPPTFGSKTLVSDPSFISDNFETEVQSKQKLTAPNSFYLQGLYDLLMETSDNNQNQDSSYNPSALENEGKLSKQSPAKNSPMVIKLLN